MFLIIYNRYTYIYTYKGNWQERMKCRLEIYLLVYDSWDSSYHCSSHDERSSCVCSFKGFNMIYENYPIILVESKKKLIILKKLLSFLYQGKFRHEYAG